MHSWDKVAENKAKAWGGYKTSYIPVLSDFKHKSHIDRDLHYCVLIFRRRVVAKQKRLNRVRTF